MIKVRLDIIFLKQFCGKYQRGERINSHEIKSTLTIPIHVGTHDREKFRTYSVGTKPNVHDVHINIDRLIADMDTVLEC